MNVVTTIGVVGVGYDIWPQLGLAWQDELMQVAAA